MQPRVKQQCSTAERHELTGIVLVIHDRSEQLVPAEDVKSIHLNDKEDVMYDADCNLHELLGSRFLEQLPGAGCNLPREVTADSAQRQGRKGLGVLQMSEIGDKANFIFALAVLALAGLIS